MSLEAIVKVFLANLIRWALTPPSKPGLFKLVVTSESSELSPTGVPLKKNITDITLPVIADGNPEGVATRRFKIETTATPPEVVMAEADYPFDQGPFIGVKLTQGVEIKFSLIDIDQAGNLSPVDEYVFTPSDVTAPGVPGAFKTVVTGEVDEP